MRQETFRPSTEGGDRDGQGHSGGSHLHDAAVASGTAAASNRGSSSERIFRLRLADAGAACGSAGATPAAHALGQQAFGQIATGAEGEGVAGLVSDHGDRATGLAGSPFAAKADIDAALNAVAAFGGGGGERLGGTAGTTAAPNRLGQHRRCRLPQGGDGAGERHLHIPGLAAAATASSNVGPNRNRPTRAGGGSGITAGGAAIATAAAHGLGQDAVGEIARVQFQ